MGDADKQKAIVKYADVSNYLALQADPREIVEALEANLQGQDLRPFDLDRVVVPTGGGTTFEIPSLAGSEPAKTIQGLVVHFSSPRGYWEHGLDEGSEKGPPDCYSPDGKYGQGKFRGKPCETCPMNQFGSDKRGRGKACKEKRMLFMLQPESYIPMVIQVPTMSIGNLKQYLTRLAGRGVAFYAVITELSLEQAQQSNGGLKYSKVVAQVANGGLLAPEAVSKARAIANTWKGILEKQVPNFMQPEDMEDVGLRDDDPYVSSNGPEHPMDDPAVMDPDDPYAEDLPDPIEEESKLPF